MASNATSNLISIVNQLQDCLSRVPNQSKNENLCLKLPQIAVVGSQSAGKSSVLESFVGHDFLPRGSGIVTRRPLVLQLVQTRERAQSSTDCEYGVFSHRPDHKFTNFDQIRAEIQAQTDAVAGVDKGISTRPINLKIYSPNVLDLTLIDLPGLTKVAVGEQPEDIECIIRDMVMLYIEQPTCLVLAVCAANVDLATSDALQLARQVDPEGIRTIGVLTKLDLMDSGTDALAMLNNEVVPLRHGYIGVVNRSQRDIDTNTRMYDAFERETQFFDSHPAYRDINDRLGSLYLRQSLHTLLTQHIAVTLPDFKRLVRDQLARSEQELSRIKMDFDYNDPLWKPKAFIDLNIRFGERFQVLLFGNESTGVNMGALMSGRRICDIFRYDYNNALYSTEFTHEAQMKKKIGITIMNIYGVRSGLFTPDVAFDSVIKNQIQHLADATEQVVEDVCHEMFGALTESCESHLKPFPELYNFVHQAVMNVIIDRTAVTREAVQQLIAFERAYVNTKHEDFVGFSYAEQKAYGRIMKRRNPHREGVQKGWLKVDRQQHWVVLTPDTLTLYEDETETVRIYGIPLDIDQLRFHGNHMYTGNYKIELYSVAGTNLMYDRSRIELRTSDRTDYDKWTKALIQVGVFSDTKVHIDDLPTAYSQLVLGGEGDPNLDQMIETIWIMVDCYMKIVCRNLCDLVPKCIVRLLVKETCQHLRRTFIAEMSQVQTEQIDALMQENEMQVQHRNQLMEAIASCRETLAILEDIKLPDVPKELRAQMQQLRKADNIKSASITNASQTRKVQNGKLPGHEPQANGDLLVSQKKSSKESTAFRHATNNGSTTIRDSKRLKKLFAKNDKDAKSQFHV